MYHNLIHPLFMDYFTLTLCVLLIAYSVYSYNQIKKIRQKFIEQDDVHKKALATAGNAITDTLKVAFDQLKKNNIDHSKINSKTTELSSRLHRLEQQQIRTTRDGINKINIEKKQNKNLTQEKENEYQ